MAAKSYTDLDVYKLAFRTAIEIHEASARWPPEERYSLTDQVRRSSRSTCANLAEAWGKRRYPAHFVSKLTDSYAECLETSTWLDFAQTLGYIDVKRHENLMADLRRVAGMLHTMAKHPNNWRPL